MNERKSAIANQLRVAVWSPKGLGLHYGGLWQTAFRMYSAGDRAQMNIELVHGRPDHEDYSLMDCQHYLGPTANSIQQLIFILKGRRWLTKNAERFDVFHGLGGFHFTVKPAWLAEKEGIPAVVKIAQQGEDLADKDDWKALLGFHRRRREMVKDLSGVIVISEEIAEEMRGYGIPKSKIVKITNGVDTEQFHPPASRNNVRETRERVGWLDKPTILFVGGINQRKRPHLLVEAMGLLDVRGVEAQLILAGPIQDEAYARSMKEMSRSGASQENVIWTGFTREIAPLYRAANVFALPSKSEGMANALLEAMASGLPAVVTSTSGTDELIDDGVNGLIAAPRPEPVADALEIYLTDRSLAQRHGDVSRKVIKANYTASAVFDAHRQLFERIQAGRPANPQM